MAPNPAGLSEINEGISNRSKKGEYRELRESWTRRGNGRAQNSSMIEIRLHGRGGRGNVVAAYLCASAAFEAGRFFQSFPNFGAERHGAPVGAFVRISKVPITAMTGDARGRARIEVPLPGYTGLSLAVIPEFPAEEHS